VVTEKIKIREVLRCGNEEEGGNLLGARRDTRAHTHTHTHTRVYFKVAWRSGAAILRVAGRQILLAIQDICLSCLGSLCQRQPLERALFLAH